MTSRLVLALCGGLNVLACGGAEAPVTEPHEQQQREHRHAHEHAHAHQHGHAHETPALRHDFSDTEHFAQRFDDPARDAWQRPDEVLQHLALAPGHIVADVGAGTGYFVERLARAVGPTGRVLALDVEPNMVSHLRERARARGLDNVIARRVAADDPGLEAQSVDRVLIVNTWHHIAERAAYARRLAHALTPGGQVWIVDFTLESDLGPPAAHRIPPERVVEELTAGGLRAEIVQPEALPKQYLVRAARRD